MFFLGFNTCKHCGVSTVVAYTSSLLLLLVDFFNFYKNYVSVTVAFCSLDLVANLQYSDLRLFAWKGLDFGVLLHYKLLILLLQREAFTCQ